MNFICVLAAALAVVTGLVDLVYCQAQEESNGVRTRAEEPDRRIDTAVLRGDFETQLFFLTGDVIINHSLEPPFQGRGASQTRYEKNREEGMKCQSFSGTKVVPWV
jgi:hypothetical protein